MDERPRPPRNLKAMLSEAKDTSELMVDLGYASLFFADTRMADEVTELEEVLTELDARDARGVRARGTFQARRRADVERLARRVGDRAHRAMPRSTSRASCCTGSASRRRSSPTSPRPKRCRTASASVRAPRSPAASSPTSSSRWTSACAVVALRRGREWLFDPDGEDLLLADDVVILRGAPRRHRRGARARRRARVAPGRGRGADPRSPTSTGRSTCWSR